MFQNYPKSAAVIFSAEFPRELFKTAVHEEKI